jgi:hypothetical protein
MLLARSERFLSDKKDVSEGTRSIWHYFGLSLYYLLIHENHYGLQILIIEIIFFVEIGVAIDIGQIDM